VTRRSPDGHRDRRQQGEGSFGEPTFAVPVSAARIVEGLRALISEGVESCDDDSLLGMFDGIERIDRLFHAARFAMLTELDARSLTDRRLGHVVTNEAGWRHGADPRRVRGDLKTANTLRRRLPEVADALAAGKIPADRARELARLVNDGNSAVLSGMQRQLVDLAAASSTFRQFSTDVEQIARLADPDGTEPPLLRDHGSVARSGDRVSATFDLYGTAAIGFAQRLAAEADRLFREATRDHERCADIDVPPRSQLIAQAVMNLVEGGAAHRWSGRQQPVADVAIVIDVAADEIGDLVHDGILLPGRGIRPVDWSARARDLTGTRLRFGTKEWEMVSCDPTYTWALVAVDGHPVACKSDERHASREQRRNLEFRDGRCCFPGCDAPANWCDAHHVEHHGKGGPTTMLNLVLLCRRHHGVVHRRGWSMVTNPDPGPGEGFFIIRSPSGAVLHTQHARGPGWRYAVPA
jgi:hypothetical protein